MRDLVDRRIGYVFSEDGLYEPDVISFTVELNARVEIGDIVCIEHPSRPGTPVFYQVFEVPVRRKARDYEEDLARAGKPLIDESRNYPRARARQIGYVEDVEKLLSGETNIDELRMLIEHIKPLSEVYTPKPEVVGRLLEPRGPSIEVGRIYPNWRHSLKLELPRLLRQGLLVVGGVGTGKTTTMLTILVRTIREVERRGGRPHILIIDKDDEYGAPELREAAGADGYAELYIDELGGAEQLDRKIYTKKLLGALGYPDRRARAAKLLAHVIERLGPGVELELSPDFVEKRLLPFINDKEARRELIQRLAEWRRHYQPSERVTSLSDVVEMLGEKIVVRIVLSRVRDWNDAFAKLEALLTAIYTRALQDESFGCIVAVDEAHLFAPEFRGVSLADDEHTKRLREVLHLIATTGPRNGVTPFIATQRPSLISKTVTTQMGQNIIAHRVEDVDLGRIEEIMGPIARKARILPRGWAIVKALAAKIREPMIVRIDKEATPTSTGKTAYYRFFH